MAKPQVFLDANAIIYAFDESSPHFSATVAIIERLRSAGATLCTSHHVIEEVIHVMRKAGVAATDAINAISTIPNLVLIEPGAVLEFAERYAKLIDEADMGVNDALLLQLMVDAGLNQLMSYDKQFVSRAAKLGIKQVA